MIFRAWDIGHKVKFSLGQLEGQVVDCYLLRSDGTRATYRLDIWLVEQLEKPDLEPDDRYDYEKRLEDTQYLIRYDVRLPSGLIIRELRHFELEGMASS